MTELLAILITGMLIATGAYLSRWAAKSIKKEHKINKPFPYDHLRIANVNKLKPYIPLKKI